MKQNTSNDSSCSALPSYPNVVQVTTSPFTPVQPVYQNWRQPFYVWCLSSKDFILNSNELLHSSIHPIASIFSWFKFSFNLFYWSFVWKTLLDGRPKPHACQNPQFSPKSGVFKQEKTGFFGKNHGFCFLNWKLRFLSKNHGFRLKSGETHSFHSRVRTPGGHINFFWKPRFSPKSAIFTKISSFYLNPRFLAKSAVFLISAWAFNRETSMAKRKTYFALKGNPYISFICAFIFPFPLYHFFLVIHSLIDVSFILSPIL